MLHKSIRQSRLARHTTAMLVLLCGSQALAAPATADLNNWMSPCYNCYNYATGLKTAFFAQPGGGVNIPVTCNDVTMKAVADGLTAVPWAPGQAVPNVPAGKCLVALAVDPTPGVWNLPDGRQIPKSDYHWYRLNADGTWSDKPGGTKAKVTQNNGMNITDPSTANRGRYTMFCGYFTVMPAMPPNLQGLGAWTPPGAGATVGWMINSGAPNPEDTLASASILNSFMPSGPALSFTPDLGDPSQGPAGNYVVLGSSASLSVPGVYFRASDGYVAAYSALDGPSMQITYYADNNGLGAYLNSVVPTPGSGGLLLSAGIFAVRRRRRY